MLSQNLIFFQLNLPAFLPPDIKNHTKRAAYCHGMKANFLHDLTKTKDHIKNGLLFLKY